MGEILALIGQVCLIAWLQTLIGMLLDQTEKPYIKQVLYIACYAGSLYLLLQFIINNVLSEMYTMFKFAF